jgi:2-iminobutanoate/2-iminopropanoate deaminase
VIKEHIQTEHAPAPAGPYSVGLAVDDWIFLAGQGGVDPSTGDLVRDDITAQTDRALRNIDALLRAAGATLDDVVACLVHLADLDDFAAFNAAYERHFAGAKPVRTTVRADLLSGMRVEMTVVASRPKQTSSPAVL